MKIQNLICHKNKKESEDIYASFDCTNNDDDVLEPQVDPNWAKIVNNSWDCTTRK